MEHKKDITHKYKRKVKYTKREIEQMKLNGIILPFLAGDIDDPFILVAVKDDFNLFKRELGKLSHASKTTPSLKYVKGTPKYEPKACTLIVEKKLHHNHLGIYVVIKKNGTRKKAYITYRNIMLIIKKNPDYKDWLVRFIGVRNDYFYINEKNLFPLGHIFSKEEQEFYRDTYKFTKKGEAIFEEK